MTSIVKVFSSGTCRKMNIPGITAFKARVLIISLGLFFSTAMNLLLHAQPNPGLTATNVPKPSAKQTWSIGVYMGLSPFSLSAPADIENPVITAQMVTDLPVDIVAHPFVVKEKSKYYMFFTAKNSSTGAGAIGVAESTDALHWYYRTATLSKPHAISHPNVFKWKNTYYMTPEITVDSCLYLFRAVEFPDTWEAVTVLLEGDKFISPTVFRYGKTWWMFTSPQGNETLRLFYADELTGPWTEHPQSPVITRDLTSARPAGRPLLIGGKLYRLGMNCIPNYGNSVRAFRITELTKSSYSEEPMDTPLILATSRGWNAHAMHHLDAFKGQGKQWFGIVDAAGE
jgi:hypothetical protein